MNLSLFIRPSPDGTYYGMVICVHPSICPDACLQMGRIMVWWCVSIRPSIRVSVCPTLRPPVFHTFLQHALTYYWYEIWDNLWLWFTVLQIKFECHQFASIFVGVMPFLELRILEIHSFPHFCLSCFYILRWNFAHDFVLLYFRSSSSDVNLRQFLWELCPFWNLYWKIHSLFYCTTDQVWVL